MPILVNPSRFGTGAPDPHIGVPTRMYLSIESGGAAVTPTPNAAWDSTTSFTRKPLFLLSELPTGSDTTGSNAETSATQGFNRLQRQHVSNATVPSDRTIPAGTAIKMVMGVAETSTSSDLYLQLRAYVFSNDGTTLLGTLYPGQTDTTVSATVGANNEEMAATSTTRILTLTTPSDVFAAAGARLVYEIGFVACNTTTTSQTCTWRISDQAAASDLAFASGTAAGAGSGRPWIELNYDIFGT